MASEPNSNSLVNFTEKVGRGTIGAIETFGHWGVLIGESLYWLFRGPTLKQPVRANAVVFQMMEIGVRAIPIVALLSATIGIMLAIQGIHTLRTFGAESRVVVGISLSVVREFSALITGILVAGRSGSALAARLSTMQINQEIDALKVMGIDPVRYLVVPALLAMMVMLPALTFLSDLVALYAAGLFVSVDLGISQAAYWNQTIEILSLGDLWHGLGKAAIFALLITLIGIVNGASVTGGAEGVGKVTTRAVVQAISAIVVTDMLFAFVVTR
ncbi:MAG: ABC transporter permease [Rhodospirillaceae bacterium]|jgi:phospholipid/cholesterol/gamma-HCH transport system permease protein|nr:ABC transporter permease [Rhodospirillaceae bacterium]MBT7956523.1 ABC transporter permease [Rhodospirillaceae bacterium]